AEVRCEVLIDPIDLEQIVMNLVVNSRDAVTPPGAITITTRRRRLDEDAARDLLVSEGDYVVLEVVDDGVGMDAETAARAVEPFFTTKATGEGNGLGLATVHGLLTSCGGSVSIESELGTGTVVRLHLPAAFASDAEAAA
ncbi:MAG: ATP-binding protein, partial [Acidimicrobiales bacterium]